MTKKASGPNFESLPPIMQRLVSLRAELAEAKLKPQNYENNLEVQTLGRRISDIMDFPEVRPQKVKG